MKTTRVPAAARARAGFTILELVIGLVILGLLLANVGMVLRSSTAAFEAGALSGALENQLEQTMDRIELAIMSSDGEDLAPSAPLSASIIDYERCLGVEDGELVLDDPERIELVLGSGQVVWTQNPEAAGERRVVWTRWVPEYLELELPNGADDNDNGVIDEGGLAFDLDGKQVSIRLTLEREDERSTRYARTRESRVTCRN